MTVRQCIACGAAHDGFASAAAKGHDQSRRPRRAREASRFELEPMHDPWTTRVVRPSFTPAPPSDDV